MLQTLYPHKSPFSFPARIGIIYELLFKQRRKFIEQVMMYYPVSEICCKNFAFDRFVKNKTYTAILFNSLDMPF